jgi:hypothetical protein
VHELDGAEVELRAATACSHSASPTAATSTTSGTTCWSGGAPPTPDGVSWAYLPRKYASAGCRRGVGLPVPGRAR